MADEINRVEEEDQEQFGMGCIDSKKDPRDYRLSKKVCMDIELPKQFEVQHSKIKNQGAVGSCVAHSCAEVLEQLKNNLETYSTAWIYGYRPNDYYQGSGMMTSEAMKTIKNVGYMEHIDCPGNIEMPTAKTYIHSNLDHFKKIAEERKVVSYARLKTVEEVKKAIYTTGKPIVLCIKTNGLKLDKNYIAQIPQKYTGGHATVCYGWNESGLLIQNSWGENWGNKGCFILPYEYPFSEAWLITTEPGVIVKPSGFALREFFVAIGRAVTAFFRLILKKK